MINLIEYYRKKEDTDTNTITFEKVKEEDIRICGKSLDEVITILRGLDLEKILDIKMTMTNLEKLFKEIKRRDEEAIKNYYERLMKNER